MTNKQKFLGLFLMILMPCLSGAQNRFSSSFTSEEVIQTVNNQSDYWKSFFPDDDLASFGFKNSNEVQQAVPGAPVEVFHMFRNYDGSPGLTASGEFYVPLMVNNEARCFLTVAMFEGRLQVVNGGETTLARDASSFLTNESNKGGRLIWVKQLNYAADFIALDQGKNTMFQPLFTAKRAFVYEPAGYQALEAYFQTLPLSFNN